MDTGLVTTPFGRRPMSLALMRGQLQAESVKPDKSVDKWKVFRDVCEARPLLDISDRTLAVLNALLSFYPENHLSSQANMVVFPSNRQLMVRAHGIAVTTLRRHLAALVEVGLIIRKDSANGKRFARRKTSGELEDAYGFSLVPLLARSEELAAMAQKIEADRLALRRARERLTICRRDVRKLIDAAIDEGVPGNWDDIEAAYMHHLAGLPRNPEARDLDGVRLKLEHLRADIVNLLTSFDNLRKTSASVVQNEPHIQNSDTDYLELESSATAEASSTTDEASRTNGANKIFPLALILQACPQIADYAQGGSVKGWRDLLAAAVTVRSMLGITPETYQAACDILGREHAAVVIACMLERATHINSPGGYLRHLTHKGAHGEFSLGPMLMALVRQNSPVARRV
ncbi:replication initiation protein RepC [Rhizobium sp. BK529]|uniref:plasmid replication protein RepC n=1 Tax=unclassified Rhizobium TaxID=2613769 RepID=UPI00104DD647|nr:MULTISPECIES: plasmid replication protein RepC [unclassified Rhizobium]MBB3593892.1 replication initiation protein RepC [Rhizobium sp. BK529]TCS01349.1 replication initiation protein RepC [Rhizobium sp. BK418]